MAVHGGAALLAPRHSHDPDGGSRGGDGGQGQGR